MAGISVVFFDFDYFWGISSGDFFTGSGILCSPDFFKGSLYFCYWLSFISGTTPFYTYWWGWGGDFFCWVLGETCFWSPVCPGILNNSQYCVRKMLHKRISENVPQHWTQMLKQNTFTHQHSLEVRWMQLLIVIQMEIRMDFKKHILFKDIK